MMIQIVRVLLCEKRGFDTYENQMSIRFKFILFYGIWFNWQCVFSLLIVINYFHWKFSSKLAINMAYKAFHLTFCSISHRISIEMNGSNSCDGNSRLLDEISPGCIRWLNTLFKVPKSQSVKKNVPLKINTNAMVLRIIRNTGTYSSSEITTNHLTLPLNSTVFFRRNGTSLTDNTLSPAGNLSFFLWFWYLKFHILFTISELLRNLNHKKSRNHFKSVDSFRINETTVEIERWYRYLAIYDLN